MGAGQGRSAAGLNLFIRTYSAFLGPIFAILIVDYFFIRKQTLNLEKLYDPEGPIRASIWPR
ncbi:cytosine permease [Paracoccus cavernae]|uniref:Cytosine permease n=1 Tax=Paracoccus cavernae TaxID=1571207 RepID=A0ABT8DAI7_9RHOB|nr:cytosine permease [Paracoccus cavernae]